MEVDKDAAARFIRGALAANETADRKEAAAAAAVDTRVKESGSHKRYNDDGEVTSSRSTKAHKSDGSSSSASTTTGATPPARSTRKRAMDPFQGLGENSKSKAP